MSKAICRVIFLGFFGVLAACVDEVPRSGASFGSDSDIRTGQSLAGGNFSSGFEALGDQRTGNRRRTGTGLFLDPSYLRENPEGLARTRVVDDDLVEVTLSQASIEAAAEAVLADALGRTYVIADGIDGRITLQTTGPIQKSALLSLFESALSANGARLLEDGGGFQIVALENAPRRFVSTGSGSFDPSTVVVAPLRFVSAKQMATLLGSIVGDDLQIAEDGRRNLLLLNGSEPALLSAIDALNLFDVDVMKGRSTALVRLDSADPDEVAKELDVIFETGEGGTLEGVLQFLPNPRLKSILVISSRADLIPKAESWILDLDQTAGSARRYTEIYQLNNREAEALAPILQEILEDGGAAVAEEGEPTGLAAPTADKIQIVADGDRNAIMARAFRVEHQEIRRVLTVLDNRPKQVLLEATIAEVTLNDELNLGVRWFFESGNFASTFSDLTTGAVASSFPGFSAIFSSGNDRVALNALASITNVKVVSSPSLMVLNNQEAQLRIGDQVPVVTRTAQSTDNPDAPVVSNIEYRDTGVILRVQPRIGSSGQVVMQIAQETSDVVATTSSGIDSPTIRQRLVETNVVVQNGATLVLGGIIQEQDTTVNTKVPGLGDIPLVGNVFRSKRDEVDRTELLILIRPRVVQSAEDARAITDHWRGKLANSNDVATKGVRQRTHNIGNPFD